MRMILAVTLAWGLAIANVWAEHEVDHRYNVRGYILDADEKAIANREVRVYDGNKLLESAVTDSAGYYSLHLHLHNEDRGRKLLLMSGADQGELRVQFDPSDLTTVRVHHANFIGGRIVDKELSRFRIPPWIYPLGGLVLLVLLAFKLEKRRKRKLREKLYPTQKNKGRRKKH